MIYYILENKTPKPIDDPLEWSKWFEYADRTVAETEIDGVQISTIFLGLNHNWTLEGEPILFETMIFGGEYDQWQKRYSEWDEALKGHREAEKLINTK